MTSWFVALPLFIQRFGNFRYLFLISFALCAAGCTTTEVQTYQRVPNSRAAQAYIKPGTSFKSYRSLYPQRLEIYYPKGATAPTPEDMERIRAIFRTAFLAALDGKYAIATQPGKDVLGVRASLVYFQDDVSPADLQLGGKLRSLIVSGQLTFFMELSDSMTGDVLARAADPEQPDTSASTSVNDSSTGSWSRVEVAAARWAGMFRAFLDENLGD